MEEGLTNGKPLQTSLPDHDGRGDQNTANTMVYPITYAHSIPDCSETGPLVVAEISAPRRFLQYVVELCGNDMKKITKKLPHVQALFNKKDKIFLKGPLKQVHIAEEFLCNLTARVKSTTVFDDVQLDCKFHRHIMGKQGATVNRITQDTYTIIYFPRQAERIGIALPPDVIRIEGYPTAVAAAKKEIFRIAAEVERYSVLKAPHKEISNDPEAETYHEVLHMDYNIRRHVVGHRGATAESIQRMTDTLLKVAKESAANDTLMIIGKRVNVQKARKMITDIEDKVARDAVAIADCRLLSGTSMQEEEKLPSQQETVNANPRSFSSFIVQDRAQLTNSAETEFEPQITDSVQIDRSMHSLFIGHKGKKILELQDRLDVQIWFPKVESKTDFVTIRGRRENVASAKARLLSMADYFIQEEASLFVRLGHALNSTQRSENFTYNLV